MLGLLIAPVSQAVAQENSIDEEITSLFHDEQRTLSCERYEKLSAFVKDVPEAELKERIDAEVAGYTLLLNSKELSFKERKLFRSQVRILKNILSYQSKKDGLKNLQKKICQGTSDVGRISIRSLGWAANGIMTGLAVPVQMIGKLTRGLITGKARAHDGEIQYDFLGPTLYEGVGKNLLFSTRYLNLAIAQPWIFPLIAAPVIDAEVMKVCQRKHSLRENEIEFCRKFVNFKTKALKLSTPFEAFGAKINNMFSSKDKDADKDEAPYTADHILQDLTKITNENFCSQMVEIGKRYNKSRKEIKAKADLETWRMGTNPERYGQPDISDFSTTKENLVRREATSRYTKLRNVVISLGPAEWQMQGENRKEIAKVYRKNFRALKKQMKIARKIFQNSDSVEECESLKKKHDFNYEEFEKVATQIDEDELGKRVFESNRIKALFKSKASFLNFTDGTKLDWEFVDSGDIETINSILRSKDVANVIMVIHGTEKGKILDSNSNEIPRTFFKNLSPSIISLNFFSCFSQKIDQYYGISKEFSEGKTYQPQRHLSFVEINEAYSYKQGQVPFEAFPGYFSKLDFFLSKSTRGNNLYNSLVTNPQVEEASRQCELHIYNLGQEKSTFSVTVNNVHVGSVASSREKSRFTFDCGVLKSDSNALRLINVSLTHNEKLTLEKAQFYLIHPEYFKELNQENLKAIKLKENILGITGTF